MQYQMNLKSETAQILNMLFIPFSVVTPSVRRPFGHGMHMLPPQGLELNLVVMLDDLIFSYPVQGWHEFPSIFSIL
jgi:hypothetical protein